MNSFFIGNDNNYYTKGTLAHFLDNRAVSYGEPTSSNLPGKINPFEVLREGVFKDRLIVARLDYTDKEEIPDFKNIDKILKFCVPVDNFLILWIKLPSYEELPQISMTETAYVAVPAISCDEETHSLTLQESYNISEI